MKVSSKPRSWSHPSLARTSCPDIVDWTNRSAGDILSNPQEYRNGKPEQTGFRLLGSHLQSGDTTKFCPKLMLHIPMAQLMLITNYSYWGDETQSALIIVRYLRHNYRLALTYSSAHHRIKKSQLHCFIT